MQDNRSITSRNLADDNQKPFPLQFPYFICQFGRSRSGTTFQTELLKAIINLKSPAGMDVDGSMGFAPQYDPESGLPFGLRKTHREKNAQDCLKKGFPLFTSGKAVPEELKSSLHHQSMESLEHCSLCEVDHYQPIFGLSDEEVSTLKNYMMLYENIRQCCGLQMSQYNRLRLHGCDMTPYESHPHNPHCEMHNMTDIELEFDSLPIYYKAIRPDFNWAQPGDCVKFDQMLLNGKDFNGKSFIDICRLTTNDVRS